MQSSAAEWVETPPLIEGYRLVRTVAAGGMAEVYEAVQLATSRRVAIKVLKRELVPSRTACARFAREVRAMGALSHENVIRIVDAGDGEPSRPFLVMDFVDGGSLRTLMRSQGSLAPERVIRLGLQIARGLAHAHAAGVIHRDLKPENILIAEPGRYERAILADFGVSCALEADPASLTATGVLLGTPAYMSPEQARGERQVTDRSDIYALGGVLYEMLSGTSAHPGSTRQAVLHHVSFGRVEALPDQVRATSPELASLVTSCLVQDPANRPSAMDVERRLERCLSTHDVVRYDSHESTAIEIPVAPAASRGARWLRAALAIGVGMAVGWFLRGLPPNAATPEGATPSVESVATDVAAVATPRQDDPRRATPQRQDVQHTPGTTEQGTASAPVSSRDVTHTVTALPPTTVRPRRPAAAVSSSAPASSPVPPQEVAPADTPQLHRPLLGNPYR